MEENEFLMEKTDEIAVSAAPMLVGRDGGNYVFGYYLCIENNSNDKIQLVGKNWNITDASGCRYCDDSAGFKGEIPELEPGECFEFTSTAPLASPHGVFYGVCKVKQAGRAGIREIKIPTFHLNAGVYPKAGLMN